MQHSEDWASCVLALLRMTPYLHIARTLLEVDMYRAVSATRSMFSFIILALFSTALADKCENLDGFWYNQLGSEIFLKHSNDGKLVGEYRTAVERSKGSSGSTPHSILIGAAPYNKPGTSFGFAVIWNNGTSTTSWTAQCVVCEDGHEKLLTSWLLRSQVDTCIDKWKSTRIGRDTFTRYEQQSGPRKPDNNPPSLPSIDTESSSVIFKPRQPCDVVGTWYNSVGSEMIIKQDFNGVVVGEYRTAVEREKGAAGNTHSAVFGIGTRGKMNSTFAFFVVWRGGASVTGWVGQCHICGENKTEVIESAWLLRSKIDNCGENWKSTLYGENSFTREEQKKGPRKHLGIDTPERDGEPSNPRGAGTVIQAWNVCWWIGMWAIMFCLQLQY